MTAGRRNGAMLRQLRTLYSVGAIGDLTDGQLLEHFAMSSGEVAELAFAALVERHQAMVWFACLAIVRNEHQAEDPFQATFLVLVHKSRSLWVRDSLGPWLHQVACRSASCLKRATIRRHNRERRSAQANAARSHQFEAPRDFDRDAAIHEELDQLPEKYRAPIILCDLEGRTHQEAARYLGWPIGTVKSRQSHGRGLLRNRLAGRGLGLAVAAGAVESLRQSAVAEMPREVSRIAMNAVMRQSACFLTGFEISARVLTLTQGVIRAMLWTRLRFVAVATLSVGIASGGTGIYVCGSQPSASKDRQTASQPPTTTTAAPPSQTPKGKPDHPPIVPPSPTTPSPRAQQLATRKARALYEIARLTRELAEIAVEEYGEESYPRDLAKVAGEIKFAEERLRGAEYQLAWASQMLKKGYVSAAGKAEAEASLKMALYELEQARARKKVLVEFVKIKTIKELKAKVETARTDELLKHEEWKSEQAKEAEFKH